MTAAQQADQQVSPESLLDAVFEASDDAIFTTDAEGRVVRWGAAAERLFGRAAATVVGEPLDGLFPEHLSSAVRAVIARVLAGERMRHFETEVVRPDGMPVPLSMSLCPVAAPVAVPGGGPAGTLPVAVPGGGPAGTLPVAVPGGPAGTLPVAVPGGGPAAPDRRRRP